MKPRIRTVKPEVFTHELLHQVETITRLPIIRSYIALWCMTDRAEVFPWKPAQLKNYCAPYDAIDFEHVLNALANAAFIFKYVDGGRVFGCVPRFLNHQNINNREQASVLPQPSLQARKDHETQWLRAEQRVGFTREQLIADAPILGGGNISADSDLRTRESRVEHASPPEGKRSEGMGSEGMGNSDVESTASTSTEQQPVVGSIEHAREIADQILSDHAQPPAFVPGEPSAVVQQQQRAKPLPAVQGKRVATAIVERLGAVLEEIHSGTRARLSKTQLRELQAEFVFTYWANVHDHLQTVMDAKRVRRIMTRLDENDGDVNELLYAVDGAKRDRHLMGQRNDSDRKYDGIQTLFRDREQVERLAELAPGFKAGKPHKMLAKWGEIFNAFDKGEST